MSKDRDLSSINAIEVARRLVRIDLEPSEWSTEGEVMAFDILVEGIGLTGRWAWLSNNRGRVWWSHGVEGETEACEGRPKRIVDALRKTVPVTQEIVRRAERSRSVAQSEARP